MVSLFGQLTALILRRWRDSARDSLETKKDGGLKRLNSRLSSRREAVTSTTVV